MLRHLNTNCWFFLVANILILVFYIIYIMFDDIFETAEELLSGEKYGQVLSSWERLTKNCADKINMPEIPRKT